MKEILQSALDNDKQSKLPNGGTFTAAPSFSTRYIRNVINNVCSNENIRYLEVGVYRGASFSAALYKNEIKAVAVDNWCQDVWHPGSSRDDFLKVLHEVRGDNNLKILEKDCWKVKYDDFSSHLGGEKINVYFFDGPHGYDDQYNALVKYIDCLDDEFILFVDDYNEGPGAHVIEATQAAIIDLNLDVVFERSLPTGRYWQGLYAAVLKKKIRQNKEKR